MQPANQPDEPTPASVQAGTNNEEIDAILGSVVNEDVMALTPVTNETNIATTPDPAVNLHDNNGATSQQRSKPAVPSFILSAEGGAILFFGTITCSG